MDESMLKEKSTWLWMEDSHWKGDPKSMPLYTSLVYPKNK